MKTNEPFASLIVPEQIAHLNIGLIASDMQKSFGGTGANIAYNLGLLGRKEQTLLLGTVGKDFVEDARIAQYVDFTHIHKLDDDFTACAYVITDPQHAQIIPFYPGAMAKAEVQTLLGLEDVAYTMISPNGKAAMLKFVHESHEQGYKTFFDPGQALGMFSAEELLECAKNADYLICNEYEFDLFVKNSGIPSDDLFVYFEKIIITLGKEGVRLWDKENDVRLSGLVAEHAVDPTGCGDGFRAGLLYGLSQGKSWEESAKIGNIVGWYVVQSQGTMEHYFTLEDILAKV